MSRFLPILIVFLPISLSGQVSSEVNSTFGKGFLSTWQRAAQFTLEVAEAMPASKYDFRPQQGVMTFKEHLIHIIHGCFYQTSSFITQKDPPIKSRLKADQLSREEVIEWLRKALTYVETHLSKLSDTEMNQIAENFWGQDPTPKSGIFLLMRDHMTHHRGMMVLYLRMNDIKPPRYRGW